MDNQTVFRQQLMSVLPRLRRYALTLATNTFEADDLLQATVERALTKWQQFSPKNNARIRTQDIVDSRADSQAGNQTDNRIDRWLFTIMSSVWKNDLRSKAIRQGKGFVDPDTLQHASFEGNLDGRIFYSEVLQIVGALPETQREVILLVYVEGYKYEEAAEILGIPVGTVMSRISRARVTLSIKLKTTRDSQSQEQL